MNTKYEDFINQTYKFPQEEFEVINSELKFHGLDLLNLVEEYGSPLKITYLPKISKNIINAKTWFRKAFEKHNYKADYEYCYCTKSSHFRHVLEEVLKNDTHIETSSAFDINIVEHLAKEKRMSKSNYIICNGFKNRQYIDNISQLINTGFKNCIPVLDNKEELPNLVNKVNQKFKIGIRIASEESPKFEFYTSRLGIGYKDIIDFYKQEIEKNKKVELKMLHFFINTGVDNSTYYWNELVKCLTIYVELKKRCPTLDSLNIGGGFPIKDSLAFNFDYQDMVNEIVGLIKTTCHKNKVEEPNLFTEFGSYTVGESGAVLYKILDQKQQNDREKWNMIDSSFITTLPDTWAINKRFILLPLNNWDNDYERVLLGGLTCDSDDYYNSEKHLSEIYLPKYNPEKPLYIGLFNVGAYQESVGGYGGLQHCLVPQPKHIVIGLDEHKKIKTTVFREEQTQENVLNILGYGK